MLRNSLLADIRSLLPTERVGDEGHTLVLALPTIPTAPVVTITRNSTPSRMIIPVFFVAMSDVSQLKELGSQLCSSLGQDAPLFHIVNADECGSVLVVPSVYNINPDLPGFERRVTMFLSSAPVTGVLEWQMHNCDVIIAHEGRVYEPAYLDSRT